MGERERERGREGERGGEREGEREGERGRERERERVGERERGGVGFAGTEAPRVLDEFLDERIWVGVD